MLHIEFITIFPELFNSFLTTSLVGRAINSNAACVTVTNLRDFAEAPHYKVDDEIYGGGPGMLMKPEPLHAAICAAKSKQPTAKVIYLTPTGKLFTQQTAQDFSRENALIFICGRYEGIDQRVIDTLVDLEISIGDYVLMGGELPGMVVVEATFRFLDNVLGNQDSALHDSFTNSQLLEGPQYTRPQVFEGCSVPEILLSGDHARISAWRKEQATAKTMLVRPELIKTSKL